jgi:hypothetical protein
VDEELGLYRAQTTTLGLPAEEDPEDLGESFERGDDLLVYIPVLEGVAFQDGQGRGSCAAPVAEQSGSASGS